MSPTDPQDPARAAAREPGEPVLTVRGLRKSFGDNEVLRSIDLEVRRGGVTALIGPSGSGKTTVLRSLNGLEVPEEGVVEVAAADAGSRSRTTGPSASTSPRSRGTASCSPCATARRWCSSSTTCSPQDGAGERHRGPRAGPAASVAEATREAEELLARVGLADKRDQHPFQLSGGQQQRVGIVRALALRPQILLFDEPTSALDPELVGEVLSVIKELADEAWTMVIVTHELAFARQVADEVVFMDDGVVVERGHPSQVLQHPTEERTRRFLQRLLEPF